MSETPTVIDASKQIAEADANFDSAIVWPPPERHNASVYAAYWQERSGFFNRDSELMQLPSTESK